MGRIAPHPGTFHKSMKQKNLSYTQLESIYGKLEEAGREGHTLRWMEKSAQVIDEKGVGIAPLRKRVRILLDVKEIDPRRSVCTLKG